MADVQKEYIGQSGGLKRMGKQLVCENCKEEVDFSASLVKPQKKTPVQYDDEVPF